MEDFLLNRCEFSLSLLNSPVVCLCVCVWRTKPYWNRIRCIEQMRTMQTQRAWYNTSSQSVTTFSPSLFERLINALRRRPSSHSDWAPQSFPGSQSGADGRPFVFGAGCEAISRSRTVHPAEERNGRISSEHESFWRGRRRGKWWRQRRGGNHADTQLPHHLLPIRPGEPTQQVRSL